MESKALSSIHLSYFTRLVWRYVSSYLYIFKWIYSLNLFFWKVRKFGLYHCTSLSRKTTLSKPQTTSQSLYSPIKGHSQIVSSNLVLFENPLPPPFVTYTIWAHIFKNVFWSFFIIPLPPKSTSLLLLPVPPHIFVIFSLTPLPPLVMISHDLDYPHPPLSCMTSFMNGP